MASNSCEWPLRAGAIRRSVFVTLSLIGESSPYVRLPCQGVLGVSLANPVQHVAADGHVHARSACYRSSAPHLATSVRASATCCGTALSKQPRALFLDVDRKERSPCESWSESGGFAAEIAVRRATPAPGKCKSSGIHMLAYTACRLQGETEASAPSASVAGQGVVLLPDLEVVGANDAAARAWRENRRHAAAGQQRIHTGSFHRLTVQRRVS